MFAMIADKYCTSSRFNHIFYKTTILYIFMQKNIKFVVFFLKKKNYMRRSLGLTSQSWDVNY